MPKKDKGFALVLAVIISAFLLSFTIILGTDMASESKQASSQQRKTQAYYIARAGAAATAKWITSLSSTASTNFNLESFPINSNSQTFGVGTFKVSITQSLDKTQLTILSTGSVPDGTASYATDTATVVLNKTTTTTNTAATTQINTVLYANTNIKITSAVNGNIGTNSPSSKAIDFEWGGEKSNISNIYIPTQGVAKNIIYYPDNFSFNNKLSPAIVPNAVQTYPAPVLTAFPTTLPLQNDISLSGSQTATINASGSYKNILIDANTTLNVDTTKGDINIRVTNLNIPQGLIKIIGSGNLNLYIDNFANNGLIKGSINLGGDKNHFKLYYNGYSLFDILGETNINGSLFINNADLTIEAGGVVTGDIFTAGKNVSISGGAAVGPKIIYAPNAFVNITNGTINSAIISNSVTVTGGATINMPLTSVLIQVPGTTSSSTSTNYSTAYWK